MTPKVLCGSCNKELSWGDQFCGGCGKQVTWPVADGAGRRSEGFCPSCGAAITKNVSACPNCGVALVRAPEVSTSNPHPASKPNPVRKGKASPVSGSWKMVAVFVVLLAAGVTILEYTTGRTIPQSSAPPAGSGGTSGANMEALRHIEELERRVAAQPGDASLVLHLANYLHDNRFWEKAVSTYRQYLEVHSSDPNARVDMAICMKEAGDLVGARAQMLEALRHDPRHLFAHFNLGIVTLVAGDIRASNEWFQKTVALAPNSEVGKRAQQLLDQHHPDNLQSQ